MSSVFPPGVQLASRYRVLRLLEDNRIGALFEAESLLPQERGKRVALKWLRFLSGRAPHLAAHHAELARSASRVRQQHVARIHEVTHEGNALFVVSELLSGESLRSRLAPHAMALHERLKVLVDAMQAVGAAHGQGLVHGGLHPGNIFLHQEHEQWVALPPVVKVLDFGISTHGLPESLTHPSERFELGPHVFLDHEQLAADSERDPRSDVYAFGVLLYHALTGHVPYPARTPFELALKLATTRPADARTLRPELPVELAELVAASLRRERSERPALASLNEQTRRFAAQLSSREVLASGSPHTRRMFRVPVASPSRDGTTLTLHTADLLPTTARVSRTQLASLLARERSRAEPSRRPAPGVKEQASCTLAERETRELEPAPQTTHVLPEPVRIDVAPLRSAAHSASQARALVLLALLVLVALTRLVGPPLLSSLRGRAVASMPAALPRVPLHVASTSTHVRSAPFLDEGLASQPLEPTTRRDAARVQDDHATRPTQAARVRRRRRSVARAASVRTRAPADDSYLVGTPPSSDEF